MTTTIEDRVKAVVVQQLGPFAGVTLDQIKLESSFTEDLGADSLDEIELVMAIEDEFEIEIPDAKADKLKTVQQVVDYITKHVGT